MCASVGICVLFVPVGISVHTCGICVMGLMVQEGVMVTLPYSSSLQKAEANSQLDDEHSRYGINVGRMFPSSAGPPLEGKSVGGRGEHPATVVARAELGGAVRRVVR